MKILQSKTRSFNKLYGIKSANECIWFVKLVVLERLVHAITSGVPYLSVWSYADFGILVFTVLSSFYFHCLLNVPNYTPRCESLFVLSFPLKVTQTEFLKKLFDRLRVQNPSIMGHISSDRDKEWLILRCFSLASVPAQNA